MPEMPAISLWQPYASLIAVGAKRFETRHYSAPRHLIGHRVAIHAAKRQPTLDEVRWLEARVSKALGSYRWHEKEPYGAIVCTATLIGSWRIVREEFGRPVLSKIGAIPDDGFGDYAPGRWCWELADVKPLNPAAPAKGKQGWWKWEYPN